MLRTCAECGEESFKVKFTRNQWTKGEGQSRCKACVYGNMPFACPTCKRAFASQADLTTHQQAHRRRRPACSFCGAKSIKSGANKSPFFSFSGLAHCGKEDLHRRLFEYARQQYDSSTNANTAKAGSNPSDHCHGSPVKPDLCDFCADNLHVISQLVVLCQYSSAEANDAAVGGIKGDPKANTATTDGIRNI